MICRRPRRQWRPQSAVQQVVEHPDHQQVWQPWAVPHMWGVVLSSKGHTRDTQETHKGHTRDTQSHTRNTQGTHKGHTKGTHKRDTQGPHKRDTQGPHKRDTQGTHKRDTQKGHTKGTHKGHTRDTQKGHTRDTQGLTFLQHKVESLTLSIPLRVACSYMVLAWIKPAWPPTRGVVAPILCRMDSGAALEVTDDDQGGTDWQFYQPFAGGTVFVGTQVDMLGMRTALCTPHAQAL